MARSVLFVALVVVSLCAFASVDGMEVIDAPINCPDGKEADANGVCQENFDHPGSVMRISPRCPPCYRPDAAGVCRAIFGCQY